MEADQPTPVPVPSDQSLEHQWLQFWQKPWQRIDPSWINSEHEAKLMTSRRANPAVLRERFGLGNDTPITVEQRQADFIFLPKDEQKQLVYMAAEVIRNQIAQAWLAPEVQVWCSRLTKALSPANWAISHIETDDAYQLGVVTLRHWFPETLWRRVRLQIEKESVMTVEGWGDVSAPKKKLNLLWQSILWREGKC